MSDPAQKARKAALRREAQELPKVDGAQLIERFLSLQQVRESETFFLFYGTEKELDTKTLILELLKQGKRVALPVCLPERKMEAREIRTLDDVEPGKFGIPAPKSECPAIPKEEIDLALVPNLLCDRSGYRLGYGGGYYDRWLTDYSGLTVSICPKERLVEALPREDFDIPIDLIISE